VHNVIDIRRTEVHTAQPLVPGPSRLKFEIAMAKLKNYTLKGSDQIQAELIQVRSEILLPPIHKLINSIWKKRNCLISGKISEKLTVIINREVSLLSASYKISSDILLSMLSPYIDEITGDYQCGFRHNRSTTYQIF
jgi:hypothetical protein